MKSTKFKSEKGITLVALIITVVILMILATVAISSIERQGIISHTGNAANEFTQAQKDEQGFLQDYEDLLTATTGGYESYSVGTEVKLKDQTKETGTFYVIEDKKSEGKVLLLAKECIVVDKNSANYLKQAEDAGTTSFSAGGYWTGEQQFVSEDNNFIEKGVPDATHYALRAAYDYGERIGGKGRLMTKTEAETLSANSSPLKNEVLSKQTWLGTVETPMNIFVYMIYESYSADGTSLGMDIGYTGFPEAFGVRPVIEISKSKIEEV